MDDERRIELLDARTRDACKNWSVDTGHWKMGFVEARRYHQHRRQTPQKRFMDAGRL